MPITKFTASADTTIVNAYYPNSITRAFLANIGAADSLEMFSIYISGSETQKARILINFPINEISQSRANGTLPASGSVNFFLKLYNVENPETVSTKYYASVSPLSSSWDEGKFTLEASLAFPPSLFNFGENTRSVMGLFITNTGIFETSSAKLQIYVSVEKNTDGFRFCFRTGSSQQLVGSSSLYKNLYDNTIWNLALSMYPNVDDTTSAGGIYNYIVNLRGVNTYKENDPSFEISTTSSFSVGDSFYSGDGRYFIGARKQNLTGSSLQNSYAKFLYCNFWSTYLSDNELLIHNKDLSNYGLE